MKQFLSAAAALGVLVSVTTSLLPQPQVQRCSVAEWIWDTLVQDIGCSFT